MKRHKHEWKEIGQTYTSDVNTLISWCRACGALIYSRTARDYKEWIVRTKSDVVRSKPTIGPIPDLSEFLGKSCCRLPCGRACRVDAVNHADRKLRIHDPSVWTGWVSERAFLKKWKCAGWNC